MLRSLFVEKRYNFQYNEIKTEKRERGHALITTEQSRYDENAQEHPEAPEDYSDDIGKAALAQVQLFGDSISTADGFNAGGAVGGYFLFAPYLSHPLFHGSG